MYSKELSSLINKKSDMILQFFSKGFLMVSLRNL